MPKATYIDTPPGALARYWPWLGPLTGTIGVAAVVYYSSFLFLLPRGTPIRPMVWAHFVHLATVWTAVVAIPLSISTLVVSWKLSWRRRVSLSVTGIVVGLLPSPVARFMLHAAMAICGLTLKE